MMAITSKTVVHHPDHEHGRPDKSNFGDADQLDQKQQSGFSRQC